MAEDILNSFEHLSRLERRATLHGLVNNISDYEWRELQELLERRKFQVDIIGSPRLPFEILILIFEYLPRNAVITLQQTCKSWRYKLNCTETLSALLDIQHYKLCTPLLCELKHALPNKFVLQKKKIELVLRQQHLKPKKMFELRVPGSASRTTLGGHHLAWQDNEKRSFYLFNLHSGKCNTMMHPGRVEGWLAAVTTDFAVVTSLASEYAFDIRALEKPPSRLRLPAQPHHGLAAYDQHLAVYVDSRLTGNYSRSLEAHIWNMKTNRSHSFNITSICKEPVDADLARSRFNGLVGVWLHTFAGIITFLYMCPAEKDEENVYVRVKQTDLKGVGLYDEHFHFAYTDFVDLSEQRSKSVKPNDLIDSKRSTQSNIVCIAIGRRIRWRDRDCKRVTFQLDISATPPLRPEQLDIWLCGHPTFQVVPFRFEYRGLKCVPNVHAGIDDNDNPHEMVPYHYYTNGYSFNSYGDDYEDDDTEQVSKKIRTRISSRRASATHLHSSCLGWFSYHAISVPHLRHRAVIEVFVLSQVSENAATESDVYLRLKTEMESEVWHGPENPCGVSLGEMIAKDNFIAIEVPDRGRTESNTEVNNTVFVISAFDPDYEIPTVDETSGLKIDKMYVTRLPAWDPVWVNLD